MKIIYSIAKFKINRKVNLRDIEKFRGNIISLFSNNSFTHNHNEDGSCINQFPEFQYKIINNSLAIMLFNDNADNIMDIYMNLDTLNIGGEIIGDMSKEIEIKGYELKYLGDKYMRYEFVSDYLPFNQENYKRYLNGEYDLQRAIANNMLETLKGLGYIREPNNRIEVKDVEIKRKSLVNLKNVKLQSFRLAFSVNMDLPNYISLGKRKSIGYGVIRKVK